MGRLGKRVFDVEKRGARYGARFWINEDAGAALVALLEFMATDGADASKYYFHLFPWHYGDIVQKSCIVAVKRKHGPDKANNG